MTQITRCPSCGTRFKVVADQLRISQGWVRCGVCQNVFDASLDLLELPDEVLRNAGAQAAAAGTARQTPPPPVAPAASAAMQEAKSSSVMESGRIDVAPKAVAGPMPDTTEERQPSGAEPFLESLFEPSFVDQARLLHGLAVPPEPMEPAVPDDAASTPMAAASAEAEPLIEASSPVSAAQDVETADESPFAATSAFADDAQHARRQVEAEQQNEEEGGGDADAREPGEGEAEPGFVREARRKAFWHSTAVRGALLLGCVLALGGLGTQMLWQKRDALAVQYPSLQPVLRTMCLAAGCKLQARREISDVVISSSGFKQMPGSHQYLWSLSLENRSEVPVATPLAELTLTDAQDKPLLRRVVELVPLGAPAQLGGHEEWSISVPVQVQELPAPVAGYRTLVFYP